MAVSVCADLEPVIQVPGSFEQSEAGVPECPAVGVRSLSDLLPEDRVDGVRKETFGRCPMFCVTEVWRWCWPWPCDLAGERRPA